MRTWPTSNVCENFLAAGFSFRYHSKGVTVSYWRKTHVPWITVCKNYHPLYSLKAWLWSMDCGGYFPPHILMYTAHSDFILNRAVLITTSVIACEVEYHRT